MKIAHITTTNSLRNISTLGDIEFCLAPNALRNEEYKNYFINAKKNKRFIIMDNGVAEGDLISTDDLVKLAIEMKIDELIIPDKIGDLKETKKLRINFLKKYFNILNKNNVKLMSVIQGNTILEYMSCYDELNNDLRINTIGIPFRMEYNNFNKKISEALNHSINRIVFLFNLKFKNNNNKKIHCLGCNLPQEILSINNIGIVRSIDSKLMARYGLNNKLYSMTDVKKPINKLFIKDKLSNKEIAVAVLNINKLKKTLKGAL